MGARILAARETGALKATMIADENMPEMVRERLRSGRLPAHSPARVWGGPGSGRERCLVCGDMVSPQEVAIEAEFNGADGWSSLDFHGSCFRVVESEWRRFKPAPDPASSEATPPVGADA